MPYALLDDGFYDHPKFANVDDDLVGIWAKGLAYCNKHLTDGMIPKGKALSFCVTTPRDTVVDRMVAAELWRDHGANVEHIGYLDHNPSREQVRRRVQVAKDRKDRWKANRSGTLPGMLPDGVPERDRERVPGDVPERGQNDAQSDPIRSDPIRSKINNLVGRATDGGALQVFEHWLKVLAPLKFKRAPELTRERKGKIVARLKEFSVDDLCRAIDGVRLNKHLCGQNDRDEVYVDFETIFRNRTKVEGHIAMADRGGRNGKPELDERDRLTNEAQLRSLRATRAQAGKS